MAFNLPTSPGAGDRAVQFTGPRADTVPPNVMDPNYFFLLKGLRDALVQADELITDLTARTTMVVKTGAPAVGDVPDGQFRIIKNTTGPTYTLAVNDGGVLKTVALT